MYHIYNIDKLIEIGRCYGMEMNKIKYKKYILFLIQEQRTKL